MIPQTEDNQTNEAEEVTEEGAPLETEDIQSEEVTEITEEKSEAEAPPETEDVQTEEVEDSPPETEEVPPQTEDIQTEEVPSPPSQTEEVTDPTPSSPIQEEPSTPLPESSAPNETEAATKATSPIPSEEIEHADTEQATKGTSPIGIFFKNAKNIKILSCLRKNCENRHNLLIFSHFFDFLRIVFLFLKNHKIKKFKNVFLKKIRKRF